MKIVYDKKFVVENLDCYYTVNKRHLPLAEAEIKRLGDPITLKGVLTSKISTEDKFWWLTAHTDITVAELQELAVRVADVALRVYENERPEDFSIRNLVADSRRGINIIPELKAKIKSLSEIDRASNALRSIARAIGTIFTEGHKRPLTIKAIHRLMAAARGNKDYTQWTKDILKFYY